MEILLILKNITHIGKFTAKGISIEDVEEKLGFPRGWAKLEGVSDKERINQIRDSQRVETPDWIFDKYLRQNRFGEPLND
ncbi:MAG: hypothetical protein R2791_03025 [Saprospiraceae bacterium]